MSRPWKVLAIGCRVAGRDEGLWRVSLAAVDGWTVGTSAAPDDKGPFARLLGV